jgi:cellulose synthase/poly-beta-1,6-N-acetylglucosamine synthase-like glycosyltransferase
MIDPWIVAGGAAAAALALALGGYLLDLALARSAPIVPEDDGPVDFPEVHVVVAVHDEAPWIDGKLANLAALDYPAERLRITIVDGASVDDTANRAEAFARGDPRFRVLRHPVADKTSQWNAGRAATRAPWILFTDADARFPPDTLKTLLAETRRDPAALVVGATSVPGGGHSLERLHWSVANRLRMRESRLGASSIVTAPCYLMRTTLLDALPEDTVADDVHVALAAAAAGGTVRTSAAPVTELRSAGSVRQLIRHKLRKTDSYLKEVFRFLPRCGAMRPANRRIFLWRTGQLLLVPPLVALAGAASVRWMWVGAPGSFWVGGAALAVLAAALVTGGTARALALLRFPVLLVLLSGVILVAAVRAPFWKQRARFPKVGSSSLSR